MGVVLVKIGGKAAEREADLAALAAEMAALSEAHRFVLVHGGGAEVTAVSKRLGMEAVFRDGVRQTSPAEMDVVDMVLAGRVNKHLVRVLRKSGMDAVGLSGSDGGTFVGAPIAEGSRTGEITGIDVRLLSLLLDEGYLPVLCSTSTDAQGNGLNVNADTAAFRLAAALGVTALVFLSDVPGILRDGSVLQAVTLLDAALLVDSGVITGGMVPKVAASREAIEGGVGRVIIGQYEGAGSLALLLGGKQGTRLWK